MRALLLLLTILLTGCITVPVGRGEFPPVGEKMKHKCPDLIIAEKSELLSDLLSTVIVNYGEYHKCKAAVEAWQQWYDEQKKTFEGTKK